MGLYQEDLSDIHKTSDPKTGRKTPISSEAGFPAVLGVLLFHTDMLGEWE